MKYARLVLKWMLPIGAILILLNGAYSCLKTFPEKRVEVFVTGKSWSVQKNGDLNYYLDVCLVSDPTICTSIWMRQSKIYNYELGQVSVESISRGRLQPFWKVLYQVLCFSIVGASILIYGTKLVWSFVAWVYKE